MVTPLVKNLYLVVITSFQDCVEVMAGLIPEVYKNYPY